MKPRKESTEIRREETNCKRFGTLKKVLKSNKRLIDEE